MSVTYVNVPDVGYKVKERPVRHCKLGVVNTEEQWTKGLKRILTPRCMSIFNKGILYQT